MCLSPQLASDQSMESKAPVTADSALRRLAMWEKGSVRNPADTSFSINNLQCTADIPCSREERNGLWELVKDPDARKVAVYVIQEN